MTSSVQNIDRKKTKLNNRRRGSPAVAVELVKMACIARVAQIPLYRRQRCEPSTRLNNLSHSEFAEEQAKEDGTNFTSSEVKFPGDS